MTCAGPKHMAYKETINLPNAKIMGWFLKIILCLIEGPYAETNQPVTDNLKRFFGDH
jgi:hypothetical protein